MDKMPKIKVEKVEIKIGKLTVRLTPDEVRALRDELSDLLGDRWVHVQPVYTPKHWWEYTPITCSTITATSSADGHKPITTSHVYADDLPKGG